MTTGLEVRAALQGDYDAEIEKARRNVVFSLRGAIFEFGEDLQGRWRGDVTGSGLASAGKVARTIRLNKYPNENRDAGMSPAALVYTNWPKVMSAFERGAVVRSKRGKFVLVPNPDVWPGGRVRAAGRHHKDDANGSAELKAAEYRFGPLRFVPARPGKPALLVADVRHSQKTGRFSRLSHSARAALTDRSFHVSGATTIVVFWLAKETRQKKRLRGAQIRERARRAAPNAIDRLYQRNINYGGGGG